LPPSGVRQHHQQWQHRGKAGRLFVVGGVYGLAKAAVIHLTNAWQWSLGESGIRSTAFHRARSPPVSSASVGLPVEGGGEDARCDARDLQDRTADPSAPAAEDIAYGRGVSASDELQFINGHDLVVDGAITGGRNWTAQQQGLCRHAQGVDQGGGNHLGVVI